MVSQFDDVKLQTMYSNDKKIKIIMNCSENSFYDLMNLLSELNYNVKGNVNNDNFVIHIDEEWYIDSSKNLYELRDRIEDFKGI